MQTVAGEGSGQPAGASRRSGERLVTAGGYLALFVLGVLQSLIGTFQYSRALGPVPVAALGFAVLIGVTSVLGAWGMHRPLAGLMPAIGWFLTSFVLAMGTAGGSVLISNTSAGQWFLYGGSVCAAAGVVVGFIRWSPRRALARGGQHPQPSFPARASGPSTTGAVEPDPPELDAPSDAREPER